MDLIDRVPLSPQIRKAYAFWSHFYDWVAAPLEHGARRRALDAARLNEHDRILEVGMGTGTILREIRKRAAGHAMVCGTDLSGHMIRKARRNLGNAAVHLLQSDAKALPFGESSFGLVYSAYVLDLLPLTEIPSVLHEFRRVLKPGGRLVLVNMSKEHPDERTWFERIYRAIPLAAVAYVLGGCRPVYLLDDVKTAGFENTTREFVPQAIPSEIVVATKPYSS